MQPVLDALSCTLFPAFCVLCSEPLLRFSPHPVCQSCFDRLTLQTGTLCYRCGEDLGLASFSTGDPRFSAIPHEDQLCRPCRLASPAFRRAVAFGVYEGELRELIHLLKYRRMTTLARVLGDRLSQTVAALPELADSLLIVPVPLHRTRRRTRGFNQTEGIARGVAAGLSKTGRKRQIVHAPNLLQRRRATESQASLSARARRRNLKGAFFVPRPERVAGRHLLLVDDIYTTGATARVCSQVLMRAGAASVVVATVARAQREGVALWDATTSLGRQPAPVTADSGFRQPLEQNV